MKYLIFFIFIIVLISFSIGLFPYIKFFGAMPNLLLLFVITFSMEKDNDDALFVATASGLVLDCYTGLAIGSFAFAFLIIAVLLRLFLNKFLVYELTWKTVAAVVVVTTAAVSGLVLGYNEFLGTIGLRTFYLSPQTVLARLGPEIVYNLVLLYPIYVLTGWLKSLIVELTVKRRRYLN